MKQQILFLMFLVSASLAGPVRDSRIVQGYDAVDGQFPFMVSLRYFWNHDHFCGGSIFSERWVLSAAHCTYTSTPLNTRIVAGTVHLRGGLNAFTHGVSHVINHPEFIDGEWGNDISVLRATHPFIFSAFIQPIRLGSEFVGGGLDAIALGWGNTDQLSTSGPPDILKWINQRTMTNAECAARHGEDFVLPVHLCSFSRYGQGICEGDSGGPLVVNNAVVGVASFVTFPCSIGWPDGWDRVSSFIGWITENAVG